jgi:hypothetical protein
MTDFKRTSESCARTAEIARKIRSGEIQVTYVRSSRINDLRKWISKVLEAVGHPEAFVTDLSICSDFWDQHAKEDGAKNLSRKLGFRVAPGDRVVDVAGKLRLESLQ